MAPYNDSDWLRLTHLNGTPMLVRKNLLVSVSYEEIAGKEFREPPTKMTVVSFLMGTSLLRLEVQETYAELCEGLGVPCQTSEQ